MPFLNSSFFDRSPLVVAPELLGKVIRHYHDGLWLSAMIIETEAYLIDEKGSHASLGFTEKRKALFMEAGTIYMYYARGGDSFNMSCQGEGNAVLIKSGLVYVDGSDGAHVLEKMHQLNPLLSPKRQRPRHRLCSGQTLLCKALHLKVPEWNQQKLDPNRLKLEDVGYVPQKIIQAPRLGIPKGRDEQLMYRFIDYDHARSCTKNPLTKRTETGLKNYHFIDLH